MEKVDVAIAVAGVVVLAAAIAGSALYGSTAGSPGGVAVTFDVHAHDLEPQSTSRNGDGDVTFTFDVANVNVTELVFEATATAPVGGSATAPDVTVTVESPDGSTFGGDGARVEIPWATVPEEFTGSRGDVPAPDASAQGAWTVHVTVSSGAPTPVPYTVDVSATVTDYHAAFASG